MRILQIGGALAGAQKTIEEAIHFCATECGHESRILYARGASDDKNIICYEKRWENLLTRALRKYVGKRPCFAALQTLRIIRKIEAYTPDIIHLHVLHHGYTDAGLLLHYLAKKNLPVVYTMHDMWAQTGGCYYYTETNCRKFRTGCQNCPAAASKLDVPVLSVDREWKKKKKAWAAIEKLHLVAVSEWVKTEMQQGYLADREIKVIPNGVFSETEGVQSKEDRGKNKKQIQIICVAASWDQRKGIDIILSMARLLGQGFEVLVIGSAEDRIKAAAPENVHFYGYCKDRAELKKLYAAADLHVSASREETFGMTFVEAAAAGTRCIGFASTAVEETLRATGGVALKTYTAQALHDAVIHLVETGGCRLSKQEIDAVKERFSAQRMAQAYINYYADILSR